MYLGYALSSEEHGPLALVHNAVAAERAGFGFALVSDHFHPWVDRQGESPFVWSVLGAIAAETEQLVVGTGVTCPTIRMHPAIVAHAAATAAAMFRGRFFLGVGTGENLNEHVLGDRWPPPDVRREMLAEAIALIDELWTGSLTTFRGRHYTVENARLYTLPEDRPPLAVAAGGTQAAELAGQLGDALVVTSPDEAVIETFRLAAGNARPIFGQLTVCVGGSEQEAAETALEWWPNGGLTGTLAQELPLPSHFEAAAEMVTADAMRREVVCGPDADRHVEAIEAFVDAGVDHVYVHQVGPDQAGMIAFYEREVMPKLDLEPGAAIGTRQGVPARR